MGDICSAINDDYKEYLENCEFLGLEPKSFDQDFYADSWRVKQAFKSLVRRTDSFYKTREDHLDNGRFTPQD